MKRVREIAKIIENHLGYTNGWKVSNERYKEDCTDAAKDIIRCLRLPAKRKGKRP